MTPREFLEAVVRFDVAEFRDEYGDIRRAYVAAEMTRTDVLRDRAAGSVLGCGGSLRQHIFSCPGAGIEDRLVIFRIVDANILPPIGVDLRTACSETNAFVSFQIIVQLCS